MNRMGGGICILTLEPLPHVKKKLRQTYMSDKAKEKCDIEPADVDS